ncbi:MAG: tRNA (adenosine(37)-N6)-threonylcarbamoyltransferase complex transferase subunit TsaD [Planctomycetota bacterium]|nr:tRNA (adenosine(37)-N6)-threonylcarbamoyltransferase complex transferase subunit TsaD [Planctomycetota bacterium]
MGHESLILGLETSCDETAAAVVRSGRHVLSNVIATQHDLHEEFAGVVPEIASRAHLERISPVIEKALGEAKVTFEALDAISVGHRPGLIGSLLVGVSAAKALAWSLGKPLIGVDHVQSHLYAGLLDSKPVTFPALGLVVSGGHTSLFLVNDPLDLHSLGKTIDDAIGEAYDKAATILKLGYPGGPKLDALAQQGNDRAHTLPISMLGKDRLDFSYSGLKTALLYSVCGQPVGRGTDAHFLRDASSYNDQEKADFAASFQRAAIGAIMKNLIKALDRHDEITTVLVGGGVSANSLLREKLTELGVQRGLDVRLPEMDYCLDNAAMIAGLASIRFERGEFDDFSLSAAPRSAIA